MKVEIGDRIEEVDCPQNAYAVIEIGDTVVTAWSKGTGHPIRYKIKGQDEEHTAENIYALRSKVRNTVPF